MFTGLVAELGTIVALKPLNQSYNITVKANKVLNNVMPETVKLTNLRHLKSGDKVNLERTLRLCDGLDGHIVSGHVEGVGVIASKKAEGIAEVVTIKTPPELLKYIIKKGSIAIDGISLTVTEVTATGFSVSLIPHTAAETTLGFKKPGDEVNLETDIIGKYVEHLLNFKAPDHKQGLSKAKLFENGFI